MLSLGPVLRGTLFMFQGRQSSINIILRLSSVSLKHNLRILKELVAAGGHLGPRAVGCHGGMMKAQKQKFVASF